MKDIIHKIVSSWAQTDSEINSNEEILKWVYNLNDTLKVSIIPTRLKKDSFWKYDIDESIIKNENNSFFSIQGIEKDMQQQPIIVQEEIGYLGMICKEIEGTIYFLMQAKIEPGNINKIQLSPTLQATKSNFEQVHGGRKVKYIDYFLNPKHLRLVDQIQSEQSSRFYKKRNRNTIILVDEEIQVYDNYKWMTLGQIKKMMRNNNMVNMDTRTVLSCIPFVLYTYSNEELNEIQNKFKDKTLFKSIFKQNHLNNLINVYEYINNHKMFNQDPSKLIPLNRLRDWEITSKGIEHKDGYAFSVIYCDIEIEGREVSKWTQPLFKAEGEAVFGLISTVADGERKFLVKCSPEIGCFDKIEVGPTVHIDIQEDIDLNTIEKLFFEQYDHKKGILYDVILSEEGGRFYHEQNHNIILEIEQNMLHPLLDGYFWMSYREINMLTQINNCVNIQLRNLMALLEV